jgi:hypothetical protein
MGGDTEAAPAASASTGGYPATRVAADGGKPFSTARTGIGADGYQDQVKRQDAWERAHDGDIRFDPGSGEWTAFLAGGVPFAFADGDLLSPWDLAVLLNALDRAEQAGLCPVHGVPS